MLLCIRLCALRFVLVCALTFVLSDVCSHVLSYVLPYALICVLSFVLVNLHSHICALVCILSYLCSHLCAPSFLPRDAMFHLFLFTLFGVPCRCNYIYIYRTTKRLLSRPSFEPFVLWCPLFGLSSLSFWKFCRRSFFGPLWNACVVRVVGW